MSCGVGHRCGSDPPLLWPWRRPVAKALIRSIARKPPYVVGAALEKAKRPKKKAKSQLIYILGFCFVCFVFVFLGPNLQHMEVPRLVVKLKLQLPDNTTATAMPDPSCVCNLHHSSRQHRILNPLSEVRDQTRNLLVPSQIHFRCTTVGTPILSSFKHKYHGNR